MNPTLQNLLQRATQLTQSGRLAEASDAIQRALRGAGGASASEAPTAAPAVTAAGPGGRAGLAGLLRRFAAHPAATPAAPVPSATVTSAAVLDGCVFELKPSNGAAIRTGLAERPAPLCTPTPTPTPTPTHAPTHTPASPAGSDTFLSASHHHAGLSRAYKLYTPPGAAGRRLPLVVMLHGCTQNPDDFAAGTGMNSLAAEQGFCVLYPAQSPDANAQRCWNWFKHNHQTRGSGEAALIASMTQAVVAAQGLDAHRVFIAGLSAGGAMAALVAAAYPEVYAAVGVHSGLAPGAASSLPEALAAMRSGAAGTGTGGMGGLDGLPGLGGLSGLSGLAGLSSLPGMGGAGPSKPPRGAAQRVATGAATNATSGVPTIAFHGDQDATVHPRNGQQVIDAVLAGAAAGAAAQAEQGTSPSGRRHTRTVHHNAQGQPLAEHWLLHGAGHAWSGGSAQGSYTDASGPDASREMWRFFKAQPVPVAAG